MNENEIRTVDNEEIEDGIVVEEESGIGTGLAMLIGSGLTLAGIAGFKGVKKLLAKRKAKKIHKIDDDGDVIDVDDEDIDIVDVDDPE